MTVDFTPKGVCSKKIEVTVENDIVTNVRFVGGCGGNTQGVAALCIGRNAKEVIEILKDIKCGFRNTSCPAQLALAIEEAIK